MKAVKIILALLWLMSYNNINAHPNGNIIVTENDCVLWPYVSPIGDIGHHACVMLWDQDSEPRLFLKSEHEASDYFLFTKGKNVYIIEGRYINGKDVFESRVLKTSLNFEPPKVIWDWFQDEWHIGVGGFKMLSDYELMFVKYPQIYTLKKGGKATVHFNFPLELKKMKPVDHDKLLLLGDHNIWLTDSSGQILKQWENLIETLSKDIPLNSNSIYDATYFDGKLLYAYWGKRTFEVIDRQNIRTTILETEQPWVPHWVAYFKDQPLLFSSFLDFENTITKDRKKSTIAPRLVLISKNKTIPIWK